MSHDKKNTSFFFESVLLRETHTLEELFKLDNIMYYGSDSLFWVFSFISADLVVSKVRNMMQHLQER